MKPVMVKLFEPRQHAPQDVWEYMTDKWVQAGQEEYFRWWFGMYESNIVDEWLYQNGADKNDSYVLFNMD